MTMTPRFEGQDPASGKRKAPLPNRSIPKYSDLTTAQFLKLPVSVARSVWDAHWDAHTQDSQ